MILLLIVSTKTLRTYLKQLLFQYNHKTSFMNNGIIFNPLLINKKGTPIIGIDVSEFVNDFFVDTNILI